MTSEQVMKKISVLGYGWLGQSLHQFWKDEPPKIQAEFFSQSGRQESSTFSLEEDTTELPSKIESCEVLIITIPPGRQPNCYLKRIKKLTEILPEDKKVILIGTTSVFEKNSGLCSEETPPDTESPRAKTLVQVEKEILTSFKNSLVIRSAGQIGKTRPPARSLANRTSIKEMPQGNVPVNIIHQDDLVRICTMAIERDLKGILHAVSPFHPLKKDFYKEQAISLGLSLLEFPTNQTSDKVIESQILKDLGYSFVNERCEILGS